MPYSKHWSPAYPNKTNTHDSNTWYKAASQVRREDAAAINSVAGQQGLLSQIIDQAIKQTADAIRLHKLSFLDSDDFIRWVCERKFTGFRERAVGCPPPTPSGQPYNDRRRTEEACQRIADVTHVATSVGENPTRKGGGEGTEGRRVGGGGRGRGTGRVAKPTDTGNIVGKTKALPTRSVSEAIGE